MAENANSAPLVRPQSLASSGSAPFQTEQAELTRRLTADAARYERLRQRARDLLQAAYEHAAAARLTDAIAGCESTAADGKWDSEWDDARAALSRANLFADGLSALHQGIDAREAAPGNADEAVGASIRTLKLSRALAPVPFHDWGAR